MLKGMHKHKLITCKMAAAQLGMSAEYIRRLIMDGKIKAERLGHDWLMTPKAISHIKRQRKSSTKESEDADSE